MLFARPASVGWSCLQISDDAATALNTSNQIMKRTSFKPLAILFNTSPLFALRTDLFSLLIQPAMCRLFLRLPFVGANEILD
jgi:hypothetical protein